LVKEKSKLNAKLKIYYKRHFFNYILLIL
jgi:hypothetical protein